MCFIFAGHANVTHVIIMCERSSRDALPPIFNIILLNTASCQDNESLRLTFGISTPRMRLAIINPSLTDRIAPRFNPCHIDRLIDFSKREAMVRER